MKILNQKSELVHVDKLATHPRNPRKGNVKLIQHSIAEHGFYGAIIAQTSTGHVLAGNHTLQAAIEQGAKKVPVIWLDVDDDRALRILLMDNRSSDLGTYHSDELHLLLRDLAAGDDGLKGTGYDDSSVRQALEDLENAGDGSDLGDDPFIPEVRFAVLVECESEQEQQKIYTKLSKEGMTCRVLVV